MTAPAFYTEADCDLTAFEAALDAPTPATPLAAEMAGAIPVYDVAAVDFADPGARRALMAEWALALGPGAGAVILRDAVSDLQAIDKATAVYLDLIAAEKAAHGEKLDHFAAAGANDRLWNSAQKLCLTAPEVFARYHAAPAIDAVAEAWLGPAYQMTAQVNLVHPGGAAQSAHRDYHLGFQTPEDAAAWPAHAHVLSPSLTLQGAVAHCDISVESGVTKLLPGSQRFGPGYLAYERPEFRELLEERCVQAPLAKGDALFFNPAIFHAAGENRTRDVERFGNLLQISSAFGRAMEALKRDEMAAALYAPLASGIVGPVDGPRARAVIAAAAEGYPFPSNLDTDPPQGGLAPEAPAALMRRMLGEGASVGEFTAALERRAAARAP